MFTFKGVTSLEMGLLVGNNFSYPSTSRDIEFIDIDGRDGSLAIDRGRYNDVIRALPVMLKTTEDALEEKITQITNWLLTDVNYHDFLWDEDLDFVYRAMCHQRYDIARLLKNFGRGIIYFRMHPIKYLNSALTEMPVINNQVVNNPFGVDAMPRLRVVGSGNIDINIGNQRLRLRSIAGGCIVDTLSQTITNLGGQATLFHSMYDPFPVLRPGNNNFTISSGAQVHVISRLGALV